LSLDGNPVNNAGMNETKGSKFIKKTHPAQEAELPFVFDIRPPSLSLPFHSSEKEGFVVCVI